MDITKIEANKNHFFYQNMTAGLTQFTVNIHSVPFTPDYMIVHTIHYEPNNADALGPYLLYCDLVGNDIGMFVVTSADAVHNIPSPIPTPKLYFELKKPVIGAVTFQIRTINPVQNWSLLGYMLICIEFVKLKAEKPQKIY